jgi:ferredoxin
MIVAERKSLEQIEAMIAGRKRVLIAGCGTCVAVCMAGGEKEVQLLASQLRVHGRLQNIDRAIDETTVTRQCDREYLDQMQKFIGEYDAVISMACGAGVQFLAERYDGAVVLPALNTRFIGVAEGAGVWTQRCVACAECILDRTGGVCPMTICAKNLLNGPCGGTNHGKCEVDSAKDCAWTLIYKRMEKLGRLEYLKKIEPPKNYQVAVKPGRYTHEAYVQNEPATGKE